MENQNIVYNDSIETRSNSNFMSDEETDKDRAEYQLCNHVLVKVVSLLRLYMLEISRIK